jgi:drug/metabolite transporter (DMT)-like permease
MGDPGPVGPASVVAFGLLSAVAWGIADFGGGVASRRATLFGVVLVSQFVGLVLTVGLAILRGEPWPAPADFGWSALSGVIGAVAVLALYGGLAFGRMGVVAPVAGVLGASIPVVAGILLEGLPQPIVLAGIGLAIAAVVLVSRVAGHPGSGRSGLELGIVAGVCIGLFNVTISRIDESLVFSPIAIVRIVAIVIVAAVMLVGRRPGRVPVGLLPAVAVVGVLDMTGVASFLLAEQTGPLAVASILSSLYPVTTVILAAVVLHERVTRDHAVGIAAAAVAILLIGAGSTA